MRTPLTVATGLVLVAGVVVGLTVGGASPEDGPVIAPITVQAPQESESAVAETAPIVPTVPDAAQAPAQDPAAVPPSSQPEPQPQPQPQPEPEPQPEPRQETPRDPDGYVQPPPAADDDGDDGGDDDGEGDDGDDDAGGDD